jgi:hypothetical protein
MIIRIIINHTSSSISLPSSSQSSIMDLLASLNVEDLPEQQTRIQTLFGSCSDDPDFNQKKLGFDACCTCGKVFPKVVCQNCHRVKYCTKECSHNDTVPDMNNTSSGYGDDGDDELGVEQALGHTSVICALLCICNDDEIVEEADKKELSTLTTERRNAATDRVVSEFESYPATLANVIMEGPCYQEALQKSTRTKTLTIHVIGSSTDSELWEGHPDKMQERNVFSCYADALAEIAEKYKMDSILLQFFGPECPKNNIDETFDIPPVQAKKSMTKLRVQTQNIDYDGSDTNGNENNQSSPDILVFFNPGFTCPDYDWEKTLASCMKNKQLPFLVTTNTEMEALADMQYLFDRKLFQDISPTLQMILQNNDDADDIDNLDDDNDDDDDDESDNISSFFSLNPYCGLRVRQSGTMANDLYVKSRWLFGGISGPLTKEVASLSKKESSSKRKRVVGENANNKKANPALV